LPPARPRAATRALARIRDSGLHPAAMLAIPGAAGGPKALGIQGLDMAIFGQWLPEAPQPRSRVGASIGSRRFASVCKPDPVGGLQRRGELYTTQRLPKGFTVTEISGRCATMLD